MARTKRVARSARPEGVERLLWRLCLGESLADEPDQWDAGVAELCYEIRKEELHARYATEIAAALRARNLRL